MPTLRQCGENMLTECGLWPNEADSIMDAAQASRANDAMKGRWNEDASAYPSSILAILRVSIFAEAKSWLATNSPRHWARPMFD